MRPLRVRIDVTNGTATPAQPDPQTIHLNAAQSQQPQKRLPAQATSLPPLLKEETGIRSFSPKLQDGCTFLFSAPATKKNRWPRTGVQLSSRRQIFLQPLLNLVQTRPTFLHHLTWLTLTRLAVLGCFRRQTSLPRQPALSVVTTHGQLRTSFFALMVLSRRL